MAKGYFYKEREQLALQLPKSAQEKIDEQEEARLPVSKGRGIFSPTGLEFRLEYTKKEMEILGVPPYERAAPNYKDEGEIQALNKELENKNMAKIVMLGIYSRVSLELGRPAELSEESMKEIGIPNFKEPAREF